MGKAYGYGKVKIKVESIDFPEWLGKDKWDGDKLKNEESKLLEAFESYVAKGISKEEDKLIDTEQWKELFAMAKGVEEKLADNFKFMELDDFKYVRNNSGKLQRFTKINDLKANQGSGGKVFVRHYPEWVTSSKRLCVYRNSIKTNGTQIREVKIYKGGKDGEYYIAKRLDRNFSFENNKEFYADIRYDELYDIFKFHIK